MIRLRRSKVDQREEDRRQLLRYLLDERLADAEAFADRLAREPGLKSDMDGLSRVHHSLVSARAESFGPYFKDRVMRRLREAGVTNGAQALYDSLRASFARAAIACLLAAATLGTLNVLSYRDSEVASSLSDAAFGLPSASLMDALDYQAL